MSTIPARRLWQGALLALSLSAILAVFLVLTIPPEVAGQQGDDAGKPGWCSRVIMRISTHSPPTASRNGWLSIRTSQTITGSLRAARDNLPRQEGGNGNYFIRIERSPNSDNIVSISPSCLEFPAGGGASAAQGITITASAYHIPELKTVEFLVYETTGETGCTDVRETDNPMFTLGKLVVDARPHPRLTMPDRIQLTEGETYNTSGVTHYTTAPTNRVQVTVLALGSGVTVNPERFYIRPGSHDIAEWPNVEIKARRDEDTANHAVTVVFQLVYHALPLADDRIVVFAEDKTQDLEFQDIGGTANFMGNVTLPEGGQKTFGVSLASPPTQGSTVEVHTSVSGGSGLQLTAPSLVFDHDNWDQSRTITLDAATDANNVDDQYTITLWATSAGDPAYNRGSSTYFGGSGAQLRDWRINVTVADAPAPYPGIEVDVDGLEAYVKPSANLKDADGQLEITNGESVDLRLRLTQAPTANLTLTSFLGRLHRSETRLEGVTITPGRLTFTPANWNTWQTMRVSTVAGAGERGIIHLDARVPSGDPDYAPSQDVSFDLALFRVEATDPPPTPTPTPTPTATPTPEPTPGIEVQAEGLEAYVKPSANLKDADQQLEITDGESVDLRIRLTKAPNANLTLSAFLGKLHSSETRLEGVTTTPSRLTFMSSNWNVWQTMSVSATAGAGERGMIYLDARVPSGDPDYAPSQDVSFDIALFRIEAVDPAPPPGGTGTACDAETTVSTELACLNNLAQSIQARINLLSQ